jgi:hypothetical protein
MEHQKLWIRWRRINWPVIYFINYMPTSSLALFITAPSTSFSGAVVGEEEDFCKGSFTRTSFTLF